MAEGGKTNENLERSMESGDETSEHYEETESRLVEILMETIDEVDGNFESKSKKKVKKLLKKKLCYEYTDRISRGTPLDEVYEMSYEKMGKCIIFNHKTFDGDLDERNGTEKDAEELKKFFEKFKFDVKQHDDKKADEVLQILKDVQGENENHNKSCCFVCCVLTHGDFDEDMKQEILHAKDKSYSTDKLFTPFLGDQCKSLGGKPKLFFIQACRGNKSDSGVQTFYNYFDMFKKFVPSITGVVSAAGFESSSPRFETQREPLVSFKIPTHADFLIACSTPPRQMTWKRAGEGSWFIQSLCETLWERWSDSDILSILTRVSRKVAYCYESSCTKPNMDQKKQVPSTYSTLTRQFRFPSIRNSDIKNVP